MPRSLLDLPAEIVQHVLFNLDPSSFYVCLLTNRLLRQHALQSKMLLLHQIEHVPGNLEFPLCTREDATALQLVFSKRAAKHLFKGDLQWANTQTWKAYPPMDINLSKIVSWYDDYMCEACTLRSGRGFVGTNPSNKSVMLEVRSKSWVLIVHTLGKKHNGDGRCETSYVISPQSLRGSLAAYGEHEMEGHNIVQIAWKGSCPAATHIDSAPTLAVLTSRYASTLALVFITLDPCFGPRVQARYEIRVPLETTAVVAMAITANGDPALTWECHNHNYKFVTYSRANEMADDTHRCLIATNEATLHTNAVTTDRIVHVVVRGDRVLFFPRVFQMPFWAVTMTPFSEWHFVREETSLPVVVRGEHSPRQGIFLARHHIHQVRDTDLNHGAPTCVNAVLKLFISRDERYNNLAGLARQGAYIMRTVQYPHSCEEFEPYASHGSLHHIFVARLTNTPSLENLPTIGLKVAVSPRSYRIALAAWRTLRIYAIDPEAFLSPKYSSYCYDEALGVLTPSYFSFINRSSSEYFSKGPREEDYILLEPYELQSTGVIHALHWTSEDDLWALTDEGVCQWNIGVWATGQRAESKLGHCEGDLKLVRGKRGGADTAESSELLH